MWEEDEEAEVPPLSIVARSLSCKITTANSEFMDDNRSIVCTLLFGKFSSVELPPFPLLRCFGSVLQQHIISRPSRAFGFPRSKWQTVVFLLLLLVTHNHSLVLDKNSNYILLAMEIATICSECGDVLQKKCLQI